jgi:hypothetical protein
MPGEYDIKNINKGEYCKSSETITMSFITVKPIKYLNMSLD